MSAPLQAYIGRVLGQIEARADDEDALWSVAARGLQMEMAGRLIAGRAFMELSARADSQKIRDELRARVIPHSTFYENIAVYKAYNALPALEQVQALAQLGFTKSRQLAALPQQQVLDFASGHPINGLTLDAAAELPSREFEKALKPQAEARLAQQLAAAQVDLQTAMLEKRSLEQKLAQRAALGEPPHWFTAIRQEAAAVHASVAGSVDLFEQLLDEVPRGFTVPADQRMAATAYSSAFQLLRGEQLRIGRLLERLAREIGSDDPELSAEQLMRGSEHEAALANAETIFSALQAQATRRAELRAAAVPRGRGRPPKTEPKTIRKGRKA